MKFMKIIKQFIKTLYPYVVPLTIFFLGFLSASGFADDTIEILSKPHTIDRIYKSMEGITDTERFVLPNSEAQGNTATPPELLWITGGKIDILSDLGPKDSEKHLCHAYMKFDQQFFQHNQRNEINNLTLQPERLFTFVQGQPEIRLPNGYGIPVISSELFEFQFMVINPTQPPAPFDVKAKGTFSYISDKQLKKPLKPLFMRIVGMKIPVRKDDPN